MFRPTCTIILINPVLSANVSDLNSVNSDSVLTYAVTGMPACGQILIYIVIANWFTHPEPVRKFTRITEFTNHVGHEMVWNYAGKSGNPNQDGLIIEIVLKL